MNRFIVIFLIYLFPATSNCQLEISPSFGFEKINIDYAQYPVTGLFIPIKKYHPTYGLDIGFLINKVRIDLGYQYNFNRYVFWSAVNVNSVDIGWDSHKTRLSLSYFPFKFLFFRGGIKLEKADKIQGFVSGEKKVESLQSKRYFKVNSITYFSLGVGLGLKYKNVFIEGTYNNFEIIPNDDLHLANSFLIQFGYNFRINLKKKEKVDCPKL